MGILIQNALAVLPDGDRDRIKKANIYIEGDRITGIDDLSISGKTNAPAQFTARDLLTSM